MDEAHRCLTEVEERLQRALPEVSHFHVHLEPEDHE
jgi:divalent metal cation (Fe/Co/Zn/Cd) transporter